jgi:hypothetical protein
MTLLRGWALVESVGAAHIQMMMTLENENSARQFSSVTFRRMVRNVWSPSAIWKVELVR